LATERAGAFRNRLLQAVPAREAARLQRASEVVALSLREILIRPDERIRYVYFPINAAISLTVIMQDGSAAEVATVGNEGMVGVAVFLGLDSMPVQAMVELEGEAHRIGVTDFRRFAGAGGVFPDVLRRYTYALLTQVEQSSACNRLHPLEARFARWLLMKHDRAGADEFTLTQEFLAEMLGVRRATVTVAAGALQKDGYIRYRRGRMRIVDRKGLERASCECYEVIKGEYERLLGATTVESEG
jgi:CRP-like cAMP-binding protein